MKLNKDKKKKLYLAIVSIVAALLIVYLGFSIYFTKHFYFGSKINGTSISNKTVSEVEEELQNKINTYSLNIKGRDGLEEVVNAEDLGLTYISDGKVAEYKKEQNPFAWIISPLKDGESKMQVNIEYDESKLNSVFDNLNCLKEENSVKPENAYIEYNGSEYEIKSESLGSTVKKEDLHTKFIEAVLKSMDNLDLDKEDLYEEPTFLSNSTEVVAAKDKLNTYLQTEITYNVNSKTEVINKDIIKDCIGVNDDFTTYINDKKLSNYVYEIGYKYNTVANAKKFKTTSGKVIEIAGGNFGWRVDTAKIISELKTSIENGEVATKDLSFSQKANGYGDNQIGQTYVEIDFTNQHMWFYKNGALVTEGPVVTGNVSLGHTTPTGVYMLNYKEKNTFLVGEGYRSPVSFWMPFNGNIGIHDASWRTEFGKDIYLAAGSHGCINSPYDLAKAIYEQIQSGDPIVCYYGEKIKTTEEKKVDPSVQATEGEE